MIEWNRLDELIGFMDEFVGFEDIGSDGRPALPHLHNNLVVGGIGILDADVLGQGLPHG